LDEYGSFLAGGRPLASGTHCRIFRVVHSLADILTGLSFRKYFALPVFGRGARSVTFQRGRKFFGVRLGLRKTSSAPGAKKTEGDEKSTIHLNSRNQYCRLEKYPAAQNRQNQQAPRRR